MMKAWIAAALVGSSAALAQTNAPSSATGAAVPAAQIKPPKPVCRSETRTGSLFPTRTCHSKEEWAAIDDANTSSAERMSNMRNSAGQN